MNDLDRAKALFFQGLDYLDGGNFRAAEESFRATLALVPQHVPSLTNLAVVLRKQNRTDESASAAEAALAIDSTNIDACVVLADCRKEQNHYEESLALYRAIATLDPANTGAFSNQSFILNRSGKFEEAIASANRALEIEPQHLDASINRGNALLNLGRFGEALAAYEIAFASRPDSEAARIGRASALFRLGRLEQALAGYDDVLAVNSGSEAASLGRAAVLAGLHRHDEALAIYDGLLNARHGLADAWHGRANVLSDLRRYEEALLAYDRALAVDPRMGAAWLGRGNALYDAGRYAQAFDAYCSATGIDPDFADGWQGRGDACRKLGRHSEAVDAYDRTLLVAPRTEFVAGARLIAKKTICDWHDIDKATDDVLARIKRGEKVLNPFSALILSDTPALHRTVAKLYAETHHPARSLPALKKYGAHDKIRIGYFSADFRNHAIGFLIAELIEKHDRSKFEIFGFSFSPSGSDATQERLRGAFDRFIDVTHLSDQDAVLLARRHEIDMAVDLMGFTVHSRTGIFAARAAPVQVNYLGFPGTMAVDYMDYMIADRVVISAPQRQFYTEKIAYLPNAYQVNDTKRTLASEPQSRAAQGLPEQGFVFCCFNNNHKIAPQVFDDWMTILERAEGSVLWLFEDNADAARNLRREAQARGVAQERLVFARRAPLPEHLARHRLADLFLDTLPYNAHTTASDALWIGLPVLTRQGEAFAGRVAASLLHAIGLPELITTTREDYVALAVELATQPDKLARIKRKLADNRLTTPLFDIQLFTAHIETLYGKMYDRHRRDLPPEDIDVT